MSKMEEIMIPTNDYVFRRIFASKGNERITEKFISSITNHKLKIVKLDTSPILEKDLKNDKVGVLDVYAKGEDADYDIEMQMANMSNIKERILFYWSKMYLKNIQNGENYSNLKKTVVILISNKEVKDLIELMEYHTKWQLREEKHMKKVLTDKMEIHIIELGKINQYVNKCENKKDKELLLWLKFLTQPYKIGGKEMVSNEELKEAIEILKNLNSSEEEMKKAEMRLDYVRCQNAAEEYGYENGVKDIQKDIVKKMILMKMKDSQISKITGMNLKEIKNIKSELSIKC